MRRPGEGGLEVDKDGKFIGPTPDDLEFDREQRRWQRTINEARERKGLPISPWEEEDNVTEKTPDGLDAHTPGAKLDDGKVRVAMVLEQFPRSLYLLCVNGTLGAVKYSEGGWRKVMNGIARYADAKGRHWLKEAMGRQYDDQFELPEKIMQLWNLHAEVELYLDERFPDHDGFIAYADDLTKRITAKIRADQADAQAAADEE